MGKKRKEGSTILQQIRELGPGLLLASVAVGGSHIVSATQAGANFGWQLLLMVVLANLFKYPFFRFGSQYTLTSGSSLIAGYKKNVCCLSAGGSCASDF